MVPIKYVGLKPEVTDTVSETGLTWRSGEIQFVPDWAAGKLCYHTDTWARATDDDLVAAGLVKPAVTDPEMLKPEPELDDMDSLKTAMPSLATMNKQALSAMAVQRYGQVLDPAMKVADMRAKIVAWENGGYQRGA
jgi:hypothetical protein